MNRKLITLAVAAAIAGPTLAPTAANAEAILYGKLNVSIDYVDVDANAYWTNGIPQGNGVPRLSGGNPSFGTALSGSGTNNNFDFAQARNPATGALLFDAAGNPVRSTSPYPDFPGAMALRYGASDNLYTNSQLIGGVVPIVGISNLDPVTYSAGTTLTTYSYNYSTKQLQSTTTAVAAPNTVSVYDTVYNSSLAVLQAQGFSAANASAAASNLALNEAWRLASDAQRNAVSAQIRTAAGGQAYKGWGLNMNGRASRIGVKGSEDLGGDLKAIYQVELNVDMSNDNRDASLLDGNRGNGIAFRNTFVGLSGNWGTVLMGRHDTPLKMSTGKLDLFADTLADMNYTVGFEDLRADSVVAYISPAFSGFTFSAAIVPAGGATGIGSFNNDSDSLSGAYSLAGVYNNGPFYVSLAYENLGSEMFTNSNPWSGLGLYQTTVADSYKAMFGSGPDEDTKLRIGLGLLDWNGFTLTGMFEQHENVNGAPVDGNMDLWQIQAAYAFGNSQVKAMYGQAEVDECVVPFTFTCTSGIPELQNTDKSVWAIGFDHNFSKRTKVYTLYTAVDDDTPDADWSGFSLGLMHSF